MVHLDVERLWFTFSFKSTKKESPYFYFRSTHTWFELTDEVLRFTDKSAFNKDILSVAAGTDLVPSIFICVCTCVCVYIYIHKINYKWRPHAFKKEKPFGCVVSDLFFVTWQRLVSGIRRLGRRMGCKLVCATDTPASSYDPSCWISSKSAPHAAIGLICWRLLESIRSSPSPSASSTLQTYLYVQVTWRLHRCQSPSC